jgi:hypothetical protein
LQHRPALMGMGYILSVNQTQSDDGKYGATEADMG